MNDNFYKQLINESPTGYAYHKIICDKYGAPCDYEFIEVNSAFEKIAGLRGSHIIGKKFTEISQDIKKNDFNWINFYGNIAINGGKSEIKQFSESTQHWYKLNVYSPEKYYFITQFIDITKEMSQLSEMQSMVVLFEELLHTCEDKIDYQKITDDFSKLCGAKFALLNLYNEDGKSFTTHAVSGGDTIINEATNILKFEIIGKKREHDPKCAEKIKNNIITRFTSLEEIVNKVIPKQITALLEKTFRIGEVVIVKIFKNNINLGFFTLIMAEDQKFKKDILAEIYTGQFGKTITRKQAEQALKAIEQRNTAIINQSPIAIEFYDANGILLSVNNSMLEIYGVTDIAKVKNLNLFNDLSVTSVKKERLLKMESIKYEDVIYLDNTMSIDSNRTSFDTYNNVRNRAIFVEAIINPLILDNKIIGYVKQMHDITERKRLEIALANEKNLLETTLISVGDAVISTDNKGIIVFMNRVAEFLIGWTQESAKGKSIDDVFYIINKATREKSESIVKKVLESRRIHELVNHTILIKKDGTDLLIEGIAAPILQENGVVFGVVLVFRDFTEKKLRQEEILYLSHHDQLTGLHNRRFYEEELKRLDTEKYVPLTLVMLDVNGLKLTNDAFGHQAGDILLEKVANILKRVCRSEDIVARIGGDEFVILLPETDAKNADIIINRINTAISNEKMDNSILSISIGFAVKEDLSDDMSVVFKKAEDEMYKNKLSESISMRTKTIELIMNTLYEKDNRERLHSKRVSEICVAIANKLNFSSDDTSQIRIAGIMHDIGKIGIDEKILNKPYKLNSEELIETERHSEIGYRILSSANEFLKIAEYVLEQHENWDGTGYPRGIKGEEISLQARIIAVADAFDAMTTDRIYSKALNEDDAVKEIRRCSETQFDPTIVRIFTEKVLGK